MTLVTRFRDFVARRSRAIIITVLILTTAIVSTYCLPTGTPHVEVKAEPLFYIIGSSENPIFPFVNSFTIMLIADVLLIGFAVWATFNMQMIPRGIQNIAEMVIEALYNLFRSINPHYIARAFPLAATLFLFILFANLLGLIPGVGSIGVCHELHAEEANTALTMRVAAMNNAWNAPAGLAEGEGDINPYDTCPAGTILVPLFRTPSADLNFTLAVATIAWVYIEYLAFEKFGTRYLKKFFNTNGIMSIVGFFEFIGELVRLPAFMFRLFGNIFAGEVVLVVLAFLVPLFLPMPLYVFELFVSFIQAFIFAVLTMAFITVSTTDHEDEHAEH